MAETTEPRALSAALAAPAFTTRGAGVAMHAANRHVERWAPEQSAGRVRSLRSLGFVDRLIAPWIETAQRSASMRLFGQYTSAGFSERGTSNVSWVFPRPWYQDELNWMAAARRTAQTSGQAPAMITTRGTYVTPERAPVMPSALYEFVAPSMSVAAPVGAGAEAGDAYSPLIPLAAVQAASLMTRAMAPMMATSMATPTATARMSPALRTVLSAMLDRAAAPRAGDVPASRLAMSAPELVTPPAPRLPHVGGAPVEQQTASGQTASAQVVEQYAAQRARIVELQRIAQQAAQRELAAQTQSPAGESARAAEVREAARRAEVQLRETTTARTAEQRQQQEAERASATAAERARLEERIAQRLAERTASQRLHEQARTEAAAHARAEAAAPVATAAATIPSTEAPAVTRTPAAVTAAVAALPPELAAFIGQRPERVLQAIDELDVALRTIDLIARGAAAGTVFEATRGPRLVMPAGLGGLVSAVDRAHAMRMPELPVASAPAMSGAAPAAMAPLAMQRPAASARVPALPWLRGPAAIYPSMAPLAAASGAPSALGAAAAAAPAGLAHVAWADRWLARFAGASSTSLATLDAARVSKLAEDAPSGVFVAPSWFGGARADAGRARTDADRPTLVALPGPAAAIRYADDAETPDDVFADIAASAARHRGPATPTPSLRSVPAAESAAPAAIFDRMPADVIATSAPAAPHAGMSAQLAASPFAAVLRHVMPMPSVASFDVRSLFGGLSSTYLAGLLSEASQELEVGSRGLPSWAAPDRLSSGLGAEAFAERTAPAWDPAYVVPVAPEADEPRDLEVAEPTERAPATAEAEQLAAPLTTLRAALLSWTADVPAPGTAATAPAAGLLASSFAGNASLPLPTARAMLESMSLPMLGDILADEPSGAWMAPGMVANRAHRWSVAQERSASDLALDFVSPELVLAARVYGLGPAEAAQAARLALAGSGHLTAMAGTVDRTFVQALAMDADRRDRLALRTAYPAADLPVVAPTAERPELGRDAERPELGRTAASEVAAVGSGLPAGTAFGVERRSPRGAFLWPSASVAALGLQAPHEGSQAMSVAALELLAARAVAELGTFAVLDDPAVRAADAQEQGAVDATTGAPSWTAGAPRALPIGAADAATGAAALEPAERDVLAAATALVPQSRRARFEALYLAIGQTSGQQWSPAARAARALALAGRSYNETDAPISARERAASAWDVLPVVYATESMSEDAAALAAAGLTMEGASTGGGGGGAALAGRAALEGRAWISGGPAARGPGLTGPGMSGSGMTGPDETGPGMPGVPDFAGTYAGAGLSALSARAGEALGAYVAPTMAAPESARSSPDRSDQSAASRAPAAMQELVRTGRPAGRYGGGEVELPPWFEAAARKMFESQGTPSDGISIAELTLVTSAPSTHIAASTRSAPSAAPPAPATGSASEKAGGGGGAANIDVETLANEIYRHILVLMDAARARNGEPYL